MRKAVIWFLIFFEFMGIFSSSMHYSRYYANSHCAFEIQVPDGIQLTTCKEISVNTEDETIVLPEGTVIAPTYIFPNDVCFNLESTDKRIHSEWSSFKEQDQLNELADQAEKRRQNEQKPIIQKGFVKGLAFGFCWSVIGVLFSGLLLKKRKNKILYLGHAFILAIIIAITVISALAI